MMIVILSDQLLAELHNLHRVEKRRPRSHGSSRRRSIRRRGVKGRGMLSDQLLTELHKLSRAEKLQVMQVLVNELANEELSANLNVTAGAEYKVWSPYQSAAAAQELMELLE